MGAAVEPHGARGRAENWAEWFSFVQNGSASFRTMQNGSERFSLGHLRAGIAASWSRRFGRAAWAAGRVAGEPAKRDVLCFVAQPRAAVLRAAPYALCPLPRVSVFSPCLMGGDSYTLWFSFLGWAKR
jgi:ribosomal protein S18 acetylase RimI-like enzyme